MTNNSRINVLAQQQSEQFVSKDKITSYTALSLNNGKPVTIANTTGGIILLNAWATWCLPCREEMPGLEQLNKEYNKNGLEIVGISVDSVGMENRIKSFSQRLGVTYTLWHDPNNQFARLFKTLGVPESYLVDKEGNILYQWKGPFDPISNQTKSIIKNALSTVAMRTNDETITSTIDNTQLDRKSQASKNLIETKENRNSTIIDINNISTENTQNNLVKIGIPVAFAAGLLSFLSPCILPLIPSYIAFITGMSSEELLKTRKERGKENNHIDEIKNKINLKDSSYYTGRERKGFFLNFSIKISVLRSTTFLRGCLFILGFSIVFVALGASITMIGSAFHEFSRWIEIIGGTLLVIFGLNLLGILKIPGSQKDWGLKFSKRPAGHIGALLIGMGFGAGWTPCIGPILASILTIAAATTSIYEGVSLLIFYSLGLAVPFIASTLAIDKYMLTFQKIRNWIPWIHHSSAALIIIIGILLLTGLLTLLTNSLASYMPIFG
ncbi:MAG TPA: cytochrome c biogenesis protein CcdA [Nitrososphaeraceae archaeon]|nr:cytochrome c biogenesis protein CcdA [Nitrososphaeraceae archaeon]